MTFGELHPDEERMPEIWLILIWFQIDPLAKTSKPN